MHVTNVEIKARSNDLEAVRTVLKHHDARFEGEDHQVDTYFDVPHGRLKLRAGTIERSLIFYRRSDQAEPKRSDVVLVQVSQPDEFRELLKAALGVRVEVEKWREIYFIDNVKIHLDRVSRLGTFVEIEAMDKYGRRSMEQLLEQCAWWQRRFGIGSEDLVAESYSDMLMHRKPP